MSKSKVTIYDVSSKLGVSTATVNRVLNNKPNVSEKTRNRVLEAIKEMGYRPSRAASSLSRAPVNISVIISTSIDAFIDEVRKGAEKSFDELSDFGLRGEFVLVDNTQSVTQFLQAMYNCAENGTDAQILIPPREEDIVKDAMEDLSKRGIKFGVGISTIESKSNYVNIVRNGEAAGAMAAEMLSYMLSSGDKVAIVTGNSLMSVHASTVKGFNEFIAHTSLVNTGVYEHRDDPELGSWVAERIVRDHPDIKGIYIGTANSVTFCKKMDELGYGRKVKIIASDIFSEIAELMDEGLVQASIFQDPFRVGKLLVRFMYEHIAEGKRLENRDVLLDPQIILNSNKNLFLNSTRGFYEQEMMKPF